MILLVGPLVGCLIGVLVGGSFSGLADVQLRHEGLLLILIGVYLLLPMASDLVALPSSVTRALWFASLGLACVAAATNIGTPGFSMVWAGILLNFVVIAANGGMPVSISTTIAASGLTADAVESLVHLDPYRLAMTETTWLGFLGDIVPLPLPSPFGAVLSVGDLLLSFGAGLFVASSMVRNARDR